MGVVVNASERLRRRLGGVVGAPNWPVVDVQLVGPGFEVTVRQGCIGGSLGRVRQQVSATGRAVR